MPVSAGKERDLLNRYHLTSLYPNEWPSIGEADDESDSDSDGTPNGNHIQRQQSKGSRVSATYKSIDRNASIRSLGLSGTQKTASGVDSLVQKDEPDPLGMAPSVATELRRRGLPVEEDGLRNQFMLSSTSFSPQLFLAHVHQDASTQELLEGLDFLSRSIEQKSASLKVLVESNFEKFVRAKATIDIVYTEMRTQGVETLEPASRRPHSRQTSKNQTHFRNSSNPFSPANKPLPSDKKKNALTKESEYGVLGIKAPLMEVTVKVEEVWGPALGGREREGGLRAILGAMDQHREVFKLSGSVHEAVRKNDYDTVISDFKKAKKYADEARKVANIARANKAILGESDVNQIILTARMWHDVFTQVEAFKRDVWKRLKNSHGRKPAAVADETDKELHMELMGVLLQLGVDENPIWQWLNSRSLYLKDRIARSFERSRIEIEIMRRRLGNNQKTDAKTLARHLRSAGHTSTAQLLTGDTPTDIDTASNIAFWEKAHASIDALLSTSHGVLGEVIEFWEATQSFIDNKAQKSFPIAVFAAGLEHLELEPDDVANLRSGAQDLVNLVRENIFAFFSDLPVEDLSDLYSPVPPTPISPDSASATVTPSIKRSFSFPQDVPPPSPRSGAPWEKFAFWPPGGNSLSGVHYLSRIIALVGTATTEMSALGVVRTMRGGAEPLKILVGAVRERCIQAICAAWVPDAERCKYMELWVRCPERNDLTTMPSTFMAFEEKILAGMQKIAYISDATTSAAARGEEVIVPPSAKLLQAVRGCFVTSLYKALSGMVENAERPGIDGVKEEDPDGITLPLRAVVGAGDAENTMLDAGNQSVRRLITLSNLSHLRSEIIPQLIAQFESSFSVKLTEESKTIRDVLSQIDARLFQAYVKPTITTLQATITAGITSPTWAPPEGRPSDARPYVYEVLLALVLVHSEVSTTAPPLTNQILSYLLEHSSLALITAFKSRPRYTLSALMQATLDVEFMAQTLQNYTTDRASEVQSQVYLTLDERTDNDARARLEGELPAMRGVLKRLREGTKGEFGCFRREKRGREARSGSGGGR